MAATVWPMAVFAADPVVETQNNAVVVFIVIVLLSGSVTAGLFFASPLRRRVTPVLDRPPEEPATEVFVTDHDAERRAQRLLELSARPSVAEQVWTAPGRTGAEPPSVIENWPSEHPAPLARAPLPARQRSAAGPWSTGRPQPDANWNPERSRARPEPGF
jgi:hypothetical protein